MIEVQLSTCMSQSLREFPTTILATGNMPLRLKYANEIFYLGF